jgi:hypothetical protein
MINKTIIIIVIFILFIFKYYLISFILIILLLCIKEKKCLDTYIKNTQEPYFILHNQKEYIIKENDFLIKFFLLRSITKL